MEHKLDTFIFQYYKISFTLTNPLSKKKILESMLKSKINDKSISKIKSLL